MGTQGQASEPRTRLHCPRSKCHHAAPQALRTFRVLRILRSLRLLAKVPALRRLMKLVIQVGRGAHCSASRPWHMSNGQGAGCA